MSKNPIPSNTSLANVAGAEARGDESNLKGTDYHIIYALWLLIVQRREPIYFFAGNDLLARPVAAPHELSANLSLTAPTEEVDQWIQLKCVAKPWTPSAVLEENLVFNFILNSYVSEQKGRRWEAKLITNAAIRQEEIARFVESPDTQPVLSGKLEALVTKAHKVLDETWPSKHTFTDVKTRAIEVLRHLSKAQPIAIETLRAELDVELALHSRGDSIAMNELRKRLIGGLLEDASKGANDDRIYNSKWIEDLTGINLVGRGKFSVVEICRKQIKHQTPEGYIDGNVAPRTLHQLLEEFARANATLFILAGNSGVGKTWSLYNWALRRTCVLFIPGYRLHSTDLYAAVANEVRPELQTGTDYELFADLVRASQALGQKLTIVFDDVMPEYRDARQFARRFGEVVMSAEKHGIKVIVSAQVDVLASIRPFESVPKRSVFRIDAHLPPTSDPTWILEDFTTDELQAATVLRNTTTEELTFALTDPAIAIVRNPYILDAVLSNLETSGIRFDPHAVGSLTELVELKVRKSLECARKQCNISLVELRDILSSIAFFLYLNPNSRLLDVSNHVEREFSAMARGALRAFMDSGILAEREKILIPDQRMAARLLSERLFAQSLSNEQIIEFLDRPQNNALAVDVLVTLKDPVPIACRLIEQRKEWIASVAEGLSLSLAPDSKIESFLVALCRSAEPQEEVYRAIGRIALRSSMARKELKSRFLEPRTRDSFDAARSISSIVDINPLTVIEIVRDKWNQTVDHEPSFPSRSKDYREKRRVLADAVAPLKHVQSKIAAKHVHEFLESIRETAEQPLRVSDDEDRVEFCFTDELLIEFSVVYTVVAALLGDGLWQQTLAALNTTRKETRILAVLGFADWANRNAERAASEVVELLANEQDARLFATVAWGAVNVARLNPRSVFEAVLENKGAAWSSYESTCATVALLDDIAGQYPAEVHELCKIELPDWPDEPYWLVQELIEFCRLKCKRHLGISYEPQLRRSKPSMPSDELFYLRTCIVELICKAASEYQLDAFPHFWRTNLRHAGSDFFKVGIADWYRTSLHQFLPQEIRANLVDLIIELSISANASPAHVLDRWHGDVRLWIEMDCLDILIEIVSSHKQRLTFVARLPCDWQRLYVLHGLRSVGGDSELVNYSISACEQKRNSASGNAAHHRNQCLMSLQRLVPERLPAIADEQAGLWAASSGPERLIAKIEEKPTAVLEVLSGELRDRNDILLLRNWESQSTSWFTNLIARVYCRMFIKRPLTLEDAKQCCSWMLEACTELLPSPQFDCHLQVYTAIMDRFENRMSLIPSKVARSQSPISDSEHLALRILSFEDPKIENIRDLLVDRRGWWEVHNRKWELNGEIWDGIGSGETFYVAGFYPAVRLALKAISPQIGSLDLGFEWMEERTTGELLAKKTANRLSWGGASFHEISSAIEKYPEHEQLHTILGLIHLKSSDLELARIAFEMALTLPLCKHETRALVHYNLACVAALGGDTLQCKLQLVESSKLSPINLQMIAADVDFDGVRNQAWFKTFIARQKRSQALRARKRKMVAAIASWWKKLILWNS
jgi:hypothetical protein